MRVLIVAKTKMGNGACIGAITGKGESVRLIPLDADPYDGANWEYKVGDVWEITGEPDTSLTPPHTENFVVHSKSRLKRMEDTGELIRVIEKLMPPKTGDPRELYDGILQTTNKGRLYLPPGGVIPSYSTTFWRTDKKLILETDQIDKKRYRYRYSTENSSCTLTFVGFQKTLETIPAGTLLRVSLAGWWRPKNRPDVEKRCYVQLSGWYLEKET